jgi:hypothetical protein
MGFVGQFAASGQTGVLQLMGSAFILGVLAQACSIEQPVSGPVLLTSDWKTIAPPEPLRVERRVQNICLQVGDIRDVNIDNGVMLADGRHVLEGEVVDNEGTRYGLRLAVLKGDNVCFYRAGKRNADPDFPVDRTVVTLRFRSEPPLQVGEIRWYSYDPT